MKSWRFTGTNEPLQLAELPEPTAGPGQVVVDVKAAGICHTDVGILTDPGWMTMLAQVPVTLGHEDAGVISQVGEGVDDFRVGDRVAICPTTPAGCPGSSFDGGFGPKIVVGTQALVRIPDEVDFVNGAAATDAGMTSYAAVVRRGGVKAGDRVGIIGLGGLGQIGARVAHLLGAEVHVAEIKEDIWPLAKELGAVDARRSITDYPRGFFDVIVDFAGFGDTTADAVDVIRLGGVVVLVGMGRLETNHRCQVAHRQPVRSARIQRRHARRHPRRLRADAHRQAHAGHHDRLVRRGAGGDRTAGARRRGRPSGHQLRVRDGVSWDSVLRLCCPDHSPRGMVRRFTPSLAGA